MNLSTKPIFVKSAPVTASRQAAQILIGLLQVIGFTFITALASEGRIYLPFTAVPITLQSLAVILSGAVLGSKKGAASQILLIVLGASGFSVFTGGAGYAALVGPTGGYILGFVLASYVTGWMSERGILSTFLRKNWFLFLASLFIFIPGVTWYKVMMNLSLKDALLQGFVPFLPGDLVKTLAAALFLSTYQGLTGQRRDGLKELR